jgi:hypothetical protein
MSEQPEPAKQEESCPLCGSPAQKGCLLGADKNYLQWFDGPPTMGKNLSSALGWPLGGEPVGKYVLSADAVSGAGTYAEGIKCKTCRRIIIEY